MTARIVPMPELESPWLDTAEAAAWSRRSPSEITRACHRGELVGHQRRDRGRWLIHRDDLDRWIRGLSPRSDQRNAAAR